MTSADTGVILAVNPATGQFEEYPVDDPDFDEQLDARVGPVCCGVCDVCEL